MTTRDTADRERAVLKRIAESDRATVSKALAYSHGGWVLEAWERKLNIGGAQVSSMVITAKERGRRTPRVRSIEPCPCGCGEKRTLIAKNDAELGRMRTLVRKRFAEHPHTASSVRFTNRSAR